MKNICSLMVLSLLVFMTGCSKNKGKDWLKIEKSVEKWEVFELAQGIKAAFPKRPAPKTIAYNAEVTFFEHLAEKDSVTYSINIITHKGLKDAAAWQKFLNEEVLAFKALERKNVKFKGYDAVLSKVRENELCGYSLNMVINNKYIANIALRYKGACPTEKLFNDFSAKVKF